MSDIKTTRIAFICADRGIELPGRSGSSIHVVEFIRALQERGAEVTLFAASISDVCRNELPCRTVPLANDDTFNALRARMAKILRSEGRDDTQAAEVYSLLLNQKLAVELERRADEFDVIYERQSLWSTAGARFACERSLPFLVEVNSPLLDQQKAFRNLSLDHAAAAIQESTFKAADRIFPTTAALAPYIKSGGGSGRKIRILPCGVSVDMIESNRSRATDASSETCTLGFVGSLKPWHGIDVMLRSFRRLYKKDAAYRLLIVGDGPMRETVESFVKEHRLSRVVELAGAVEHEAVKDFLSRMDIGLAPYPPMDSFYFSPLKVWEYAAAGVPIVASSSEELAKSLPHKRAALLHPPGSASRLIAHVQLLRDSPELRARLVRNARRVARSHSWDRLAARVLRMVENLRRS